MDKTLFGRTFEIVIGYVGSLYATGYATGYAMGLSPKSGLVGAEAPGRCRCNFSPIWVSRCLFLY